MPIRKNIKISKVKRGHHEFHKKNFLKSKKQLHREKQAKLNIFEKSKSEKRKEILENVKKTKKDNEKQKNKKIQEQNESKLALKASDFDDMLDSNSSDDEGIAEDYNISPKRQKLSDSMSEQSDSGESEQESAMNESSDEEMAEEMEMRQQKSSQNEKESRKKLKDLLPIKTKTGVIPRQIEASAELQNKVKEPAIAVENKQLKTKEKQHPADEGKKKTTILTATELFTERENELNRQRFKIGKVCAGLTENPEEKVESFKTLLELVQEVGGDKQKNLTSVRKLAMLSTTEVFKDIVPDYKVGIVDLENQKVKKDTLNRITYENTMLKYYKKYLRELEYLVKALKPGKYAKRPSKEDIYLAETAIVCLCELLQSHPYFNFSTNVSQLLVIYLNCYNSSARKKIHDTFTKIFKTDKRLDLTRHIVRHINHLVKKKSNSVFTEVLSCLLSLQIKNINVDAEKEAELKQKKLEQQKSRLISMSKRERKRKKKLADLEKEMMETQAEENKQTKNTKLTDISKLVFTIYFRILKQSPNSKLLSCTLEGLAKFAHIINIEFFSDLIEVLNYLIEKADLGYREQLHCIQTVFAILSGQGEALNIDPARFYTHLYKNILSVSAGKNHKDVESVITSLENVLIKRRKNITHLRYLAFLKRLATLSLQVLHNGALGCLSIVKNAMQLNSSLDILLDTENKVGSGKFDPNILEPEFSNANCTSFFELGLLMRHYHPTVVKMSQHIAQGCPVGSNPFEPTVAKLLPIEFFENFESENMAFNPSIPIPTPIKDIKFKKVKGKHVYKLKDVAEMLSQKIEFNDDRKSNLTFDFYSEMC